MATQSTVIRPVWKSFDNNIQPFEESWKETGETWGAGWNVVAAAYSGVQVVGITMEEKVHVKQLKAHFYRLRVSVLPPWRMKGLAREMLAASIQIISGGNRDIECLGCYCVVTDPKLKAAKNEAIWPQSRMVYIGNTPEGHHQRVIYFDGTLLPSKQA